MTAPSIPLVDLAALHQPAIDELRLAFDRVVTTSAFTLGAEVERFEAALGDHLGIGHVVTVSSGTGALRLAMAGDGI